MLIFVYILQEKERKYLLIMAVTNEIKHVLFSWRFISLKSF